MIRFIFFSILFSFVLIEGRKSFLQNDKRNNNGIYNSLFSFFNDMTPEQFKALHRLIDLGVLPVAIREPVNILRNLPAKVIYPNPPSNMPQLIPIISTIINLDSEDVKTILKLRYHGALINNVLSMVIKLKMLTKEQLDMIQNSLETEKISDPLDLLKNYKVFNFPNRKRLKSLSETGNIPDIVKYIEKIKPYGFGYINRVVNDLKLKKYVKNEKETFSTEGSSFYSTELETTNTDFDQSGSTTQRPNYSSELETTNTDFDQSGSTTQKPNYSSELETTNTDFDQSGSTTQKPNYSSELETTNTDFDQSGSTTQRPNYSSELETTNTDFDQSGSTTQRPNYSSELETTNTDFDQSGSTTQKPNYSSFDFETIATTTLFNKTLNKDHDIDKLWTKKLETTIPFGVNGIQTSEKEIFSQSKSEYPMIKMNEDNANFSLGSNRYENFSMLENLLFSTKTVTNESQNESFFSNILNQTTKNSIQNFGPTIYLNLDEMNHKSTETASSYPFISQNNIEYFTNENRITQDTKDITKSNSKISFIYGQYKNFTEMIENSTVTSEPIDMTENMATFQQKNESTMSNIIRKREIRSNKKKLKLASGIQAIGHFPFQADNPEHFVQNNDVTFLFNNIRPPITITESNSKTDSKFENGCMVSITVTTIVTRTYSQISVNQECLIPSLKNNQNY